jgi:hypothetical protein
MRVVLCHSWCGRRESVPPPEAAERKACRPYPVGECKSKRGAALYYRTVAGKRQEHREAAERHAGIARARKAIHPFPIL